MLSEVRDAEQRERLVRHTHPEHQPGLHRTRSIQPEHRNAGALLELNGGRVRYAPPAIAGRITRVSDSATGVSSPLSTRTSSSFR